MANQTQTADHLDRIESAKRVLALQARDMELVYLDSNNQPVEIAPKVDDQGNTTVLIDDIAEAFDGIPVRGKNSLYGTWPVQYVQKGYYPETFDIGVPTATRATTDIGVTKVDNTLVIEASNDQKAGYVTPPNGAEKNSAVAHIQFSGKTAEAWIAGHTDKKITASVADGAYKSTLNLTADLGYVEANSLPGEYGELLPESPVFTVVDSVDVNEHGFYIQIRGQGKVTGKATATITTAGYLPTGSVDNTTGGTMWSEMLTKYVKLKRADIPDSINPLTHDNIWVPEGYQSGKTLRVDGALLARLEKI